MYSMYQEGKLANIMMEMERLKVNVRWTGAGQITSDGYSIIYSGGQSHERGIGFITDKDYARSLKGY